MSYNPNSEGLPTQTGHTGEYLATDGAAAEWLPLPAGSLPSDTGHAYEELTTDGAGNASWKKPFGVFNVLKYGAIGDGDPTNAATNKTAFEAAIAAAIAANGGCVFVPDGVYVTNEIVVPGLDFTNGVIPVEITGQHIPTLMFGTLGNFPVTDSGAIIKSISTTAGEAVIRVEESSNGSYSFSGIYLKLRNLDIRVPTNPAINGVDAGFAAQFAMEDTSINVGIYSVYAPTPTHGTTGVITPIIQNAAFTYLNNYLIYGFDTGIEANEHTVAPHGVVLSNINGVKFKTANHASWFGRLGAYRNTNHITVAGTHTFNIDQLNCERPSGLGQTVAGSEYQVVDYELNDPSSYGQGTIYWANVNGGTGRVHTFTKNGGTGIDCVEIGFTGGWSAAIDGSANKDVKTSYSGAGALYAVVNGGTGAGNQVGVRFDRGGVAKWMVGTNIGVGISDFYIYDNVGNKSRIYIDASGNVYIGNEARTAPAFMIDPTGIAKVSSAASLQSSMHFQKAGSTLWQIGQDFSNSGGADFYIYGAGTGHPEFIIEYATKNIKIGGFADSAPVMTIKHLNGVDMVGPITLSGIVEYADNAAAITAGLTAGMVYRTGDLMKIVH